MTQIKLRFYSFPEGSFVLLCIYIGTLPSMSQHRRSTSEVSAKTSVHHMAPRKSQRTGKAKRKVKFSKAKEGSLWHVFKAPIKHLRQAPMRGQAKTSDYNGRYIDIKDVKCWDDFITPEEVEALWMDNPDLKTIFERRLKPAETGKILTAAPVTGGLRDEHALELEWHSVHHQLNLALKLCAEAMGSSGHVMIGPGSNAQKISSDAEPDAHRKRPDFAVYLYLDDSQYNGDNVKQVDNRVPGDAKQFRAIRRSMLPPDGKDFNKKNRNLKAIKVLSQIHGYMDRHEARYGYILNNEELVFLRRRDTGWGQLDISPAIRHDVEADAENGILNSKYALFYFLHQVANDDSPSGWRLQSFGTETQDEAPRQRVSSIAFRKEAKAKATWLQVGKEKLVKLFGSMANFL